MRKVIRSQSCSLKKSREEEEGGRERERARCICLCEKNCDPNPYHPNLNKTPPSLLAEQYELLTKQRTTPRKRSVNKTKNNRVKFKVWVRIRVGVGG